MQNTLTDIGIMLSCGPLQREIFADGALVMFDFDLKEEFTLTGEGCARRNARATRSGA